MWRNLLTAIPETWYEHCDTGHLILMIYEAERDKNSSSATQIEVSKLCTLQTFEKHAAFVTDFLKYKYMFNARSVFIRN
jgi:hypothetical protein